METKPKTVAQSRIMDEEFKSRVKRIQFSMTALPAWVFSRTMDSLPEDAVILHQGPDYATACWNFIVASDKFERVEEGANCPEIRVRIDAKKREVTIISAMAPENFLNALGEL